MSSLRIFDLLTPIPMQHWVVVRSESGILGMFMRYRIGTRGLNGTRRFLRPPYATFGNVQMEIGVFNLI